MVAVFFEAANQELRLSPSFLAHYRQDDAASAAQARRFSMPSSNHHVLLRLLTRPLWRLASPAWLLDFRAAPRVQRRSVWRRRRELRQHSMGLFRVPRRRSASFVSSIRIPQVVAGAA
ncbi:unnamed protein product, partial [Trichogramma brassicae]